MGEVRETNEEWKAGERNGEIRDRDEVDEEEPKKWEAKRREIEVKGQERWRGGDEKEVGERSYRKEWRKKRYG